MGLSLFTGGSLEPTYLEPRDNPRTYQNLPEPNQNLGNLGEPRDNPRISIDKALQFLIEFAHAKDSKGGSSQLPTPCDPARDE